ncbi:MAG TPA: CHAT domain-containing protein [Pyrinomonadaceae bacterium]|nr:CHAT domain-containing protein [Pyrinomonadaceae bacterium]
MQRDLIKLLIRVSAALLLAVSPLFAQTVDDLPELAAASREIKVGERHSYRKRLDAGQFLNAAVIQEDIDLVTAIFAPDGRQLMESDSPNGNWGPEPVLVVAPVAGEYRIEIRAPGTSARTGHYKIEILALRGATAIDKGHVQAQRALDDGAKLMRQQTATAKQTAIEKYKSALPLFQAADDTYRVALTDLRLGIAYFSLNEFRTARQFFESTLTLSVALKDRRLEAGTETYMGGTLEILGDVAKALEHQQQALKLARENGPRVAEGNALSNIGKIYNDLADWQKALEYYQQALPVFKALNLTQNQAITLNNIGIAYGQSGESQKALDYLQQALPLLRTVGNKNSEAYTLLNIGREYRRLQQYEKAFDYYAQAQAIQRETGNRAQAGESLEEIGIAYAAQEQYDKALDYHRQSLEIQRATGNVRREALVLTNLGNAYNGLKQPEKAAEQFNSALAIFRNIDDRTNAALALEGLARAEEQRGNLTSARALIEQSLALRETVRSRSGSLELRASYRATIERAYEFYIDLLMQQHALNPQHGYDAEALNASERGRARSLLEQLSEAQIDIREGVDVALIEKERDLARVLNAKAQREMQLKARSGSSLDEIAALHREIGGLEDEYQQVQAAIRKSSPQYSALTQPQPLNLKGIQQQLDPDTVLLQYALGERRSYVWAVAQNSLHAYVLPKRADVEGIAREVYESLVARSVVKSLETAAQRRTRIARADVSFQDAAERLSRLILAPARDQLTRKRLVVVADGALQYVPFAALTVSTGPYRPLVFDHELVSLASASTFAVQRQNLKDRAPAMKSVAVVADPVFSMSDARFKTGAQAQASAEPVATRIIEHLQGTAKGQLSIPRLPFTRWEADQILAVAPSGGNLKALDFNASRSIATGGELSKYRYVHFATHGYLDTSRSNLSAIVLSLFDEQGKPQDGFLRAHDIYNLKLPAELVVLSACETGLGKDVTGEGLDGLTRGFMYAGARRVIVSLWNVNDKATATLMQRLYTGMLRSGKTPAAALRAAQIEMLRTRQWQSPYFWAPFVMQGEWK